MTARRRPRVSRPARSSSVSASTGNRSQQGGHESGDCVRQATNGDQAITPSQPGSHSSPEDILDTQEMGQEESSVYAITKETVGDLSCVTLATIDITAMD